MTDLADLQQTARQLRGARDAARTTLRKQLLQRQSLEARLSALQRLNGPNSEVSQQVTELEHEREVLNQQIAGAGKEVASGRDRVIGVLNERYGDPREMVGALPDTLPFLLVPVRIETKFGRRGDAPELWVRLFPDDIAVAHHEKELTVGEEAAGEIYWRARATANGAPTPEAREQGQKSAWNLLGTRYGAYRASWIKRSTEPKNWNDELDDPDRLDFPNLPTKPLAWSDMPRSPILPDRFVIILENGTASRSVLGNLIPDDLPLGPDPLQTEGFMTRDPTTGRLKISDDLRWLIDFEAAEAVGMGVRVSLDASEAELGFTRVMVLGLRLTSNSDDNAKLLAALIESHRYSQGVSLVPQGAPTNNTDDAKSGLSTRDETVDETFELEHDPTPYPLSADPLKRTDGERLAEALGLGIESVEFLPRARQADVAESVAMQRALWNATLGDFVREMLKGVFAPDDVERVLLFLTEFVHGRGVLPALRVGAQPYGVLVTSSWDDWAWSGFERGKDGDFWDRTYSALSELRKHWALAAEDFVRYIGREKDSQGKTLDPFDNLLNVVGLQANAVEYWSRTGVPDSYLRALAAYRNNDPGLVDNWVANARNTRILDLSNSHLPFSADATLPKLLFLDAPDSITSPVVDRDPALPLSETQTIRPYDGKLGHNYIDWLVTASHDDIQAERFVGENAEAVPAPSALLYKYLRHATLQELNVRSRFFSERFRADVFVGAPALDPLPNVREPQLMPSHFALVDTAKLGATRDSQTVGDYLLNRARDASQVLQKPPEAASLALLTDALRLLATLPTARLERLFAEHVSVVSYRLDAWLTATFARRLSIQRSQLMGVGGTQLGMFGWVEGVAPAKDVKIVDPAEIPAELLPAVEGTVVTHENNGGFVQAPSLPHAVTAAVLRNAYLTHADQVQAGVMSVNLSSARVRTALRYVEGLQNGQPLSALLGYQLERGLHDSHPGVELDQFIYVLRERFPLISKKLTPTPEGLAAEVIEARNVIDGYDLLDFTKGKKYPFDIAGLPDALVAGAPQQQAAAIVQEVDRLRDAMDAVADLLLSESVHQVVQGNYARARGAVQAMTDAELAPLPDVVQTPRSGRSLTHRVVALVDPVATAGWQATLTPRAAANAPLNHWLVAQLPTATDIQWTVKVGAAAPQVVTLASLRLEPIDLVLMCGERVGEGTSALEQLLVYDFRDTHNIGDDVATFFYEKTDPSVPDASSLVFDPDTAAAGKYSLGSLLPYLKALRQLVTAGRPLGARDLLRPTQAQDAHPENPQGHDGGAAPLKDAGELKARIEAAFAKLGADGVAFQGLVTAMQPLEAALEADPTLPVQTAAWSPLLVALRTRLRSVLRYSVAEAMPVAAVAITRAVVSSALTQAAAVKKLIDARLAVARAALDITFPDPLPPTPVEAGRETGRRVEARVDAYVAAARSLLGADFTPLPLFAPHAEGIPELVAATSAPVEGDPLRLESWLQQLERVRPRMQAFGVVATYRDWLGKTPLDFVPAQLPVEPGAAWIGGIFGDTVSAHDVVSVMLHGAAGNFAAPMAGLVLDEWTELVPTSHETTGVAMNVNRPNAVAPQSLLLAVAPKQGGHWSWDSLLAILRDTLGRAKLRAVEPDDVKYPYFQLLPPIVTAFNHSLLIPGVKLASAASATTLVSRG